MQQLGLVQFLFLVKKVPVTDGIVIKTAKQEGPIRSYPSMMQDIQVKKV